LSISAPLRSALLSRRLKTISHHLCAGDTQLFISFSAPQNISHLETTIDTVSTWMSVNLLSLNQSKTEFLLIGLPKLSKVSDAALLIPSNITMSAMLSSSHIILLYCLYQPTLVTNTFLLVLSCKLVHITTYLGLAMFYGRLVSVGKYAFFKFLA